MLPLIFAAVIIWLLVRVTSESILILGVAVLLALGLQGVWLMSVRNLLDRLDVLASM